MDPEDVGTPVHVHIRLDLDPLGWCDVIMRDSFYTDYDVSSRSATRCHVAYSVMRSENHGLLRRRQASLVSPHTDYA